MKTITRNCLNCTKFFDAPLKETKRGRAKFCSLSCSSKYINIKRNKKIPLPNAECAYCQILFYKKPSEKKLSKSGLFFCSRKHKDIAQRLDGIKAIHTSHYNTNNGNNYRDLAFKILPNKCNRCEFYNVLDILQVHHKDTDRSNNDISNLEILCPNCHDSEHFFSKTGKWRLKTLLQN